MGALAALSRCGWNVFIHLELDYQSPPCSTQGNTRKWCSFPDGGRGFPHCDLQGKDIISYSMKVSMLPGNKIVIWDAPPPKKKCIHLFTPLIRTIHLFLHSLICQIYLLPPPLISVLSGAWGWQEGKKYFCCVGFAISHLPFSSLRTSWGSGGRGLAADLFS